MCRMEPLRAPETMTERSKKAADLGSNLRGWAALGRDWGAIVLISWASVRLHSIPAYLAAVALIGAFQFAIGECLLHEASHFHLFRTRSWNERFEALYALPFFMTLAQFREEHLAHHRDAGTPRDGLLEDYRLIGLFRPKPDMFWLWFVKPLTGFAGYFYLTKLSLTPRRDGLKIAGFWTVVLAAAWALGGLQLLALYWLVPMLFGHASFLYWSEVQDHFGTRSGTRSVTGALGNRLWHNNGYHAVHHARAWMPFYRLREAHDDFLAGAGAAAAQDLSSGFLETYRQLRAAVSAAPAAALEPALR